MVYYPSRAERYTHRNTGRAVAGHNRTIQRQWGILWQFPRHVLFVAVSRACCPRELTRVECTRCRVLPTRMVCQNPLVALRLHCHGAQNPLGLRGFLSSRALGHVRRRQKRDARHAFAQRRCTASLHSADAQASLHSTDAQASLRCTMHSLFAHHKCTASLHTTNAQPDRSSDQGAKTH